MVHVTALLIAVFVMTVRDTILPATGARCVRLKAVLVLMSHAVVMDSVFKAAVSAILAGR